MTTTNRISMIMLRSSLLWGVLAAIGFYALIHTGAWHDDFVRRYFAGHWVEYVEVVMFFVGLSGLVLKAFDLAAQSTAMNRPMLPAETAGNQPAAAARSWLTMLAELPEYRRSGYLGRRLREALESVLRNGSADRLEDELKYLSDLDAARAHAGYALTRIIIWAIPMLGFLGTVIGITLAIASLDPRALEESLTVVVGGLGVAFDTTALALGLSMVLMFVQFLVDRMETRLLAEVDERAAAELAGRFELVGGANDPQVAAVRRIAETVLKATERLVQRQADLWQSSMDAAQARWTDTASMAGRQLQTSLTAALATSLESHAERLAQNAAAAGEQNREHWQQVQRALGECAEATQRQQSELRRQADVLLRVVEATGQVTRLEEALNGNLAALAGAQHFEETLLNLSGAIHLLNARLGQVAALQAQVDLAVPPSVKAA